MNINLALVESGYVSAEDYLDALANQQQKRPCLGQLALEMGLVSSQQVREVLQEQNNRHRRLFGQIAISMGYLSQSQLAELLVEQISREYPAEKYLVETGKLTPDQLESLKDFQLANQKTVQVIAQEND